MAFEGSKIHFRDFPRNILLFIFLLSFLETLTSAKTVIASRPYSHIFIWLNLIKLENKYGISKEKSVNTPL